ncbi:MAG: GtrA family protein [Rhodanobacter sp.]|nr:GtrA family protein [Rhodanobacter sp.]
MTAAIPWLRAMVEKHRFVRFLISGGLNTVATYAMYLAMLQVTSYQIAYTIAYIFGIIVAFAINRFFVFGGHRGWRSIVYFPFVYLAQYLVSLAILWFWVSILHLPQELAPLISIALTLPLTFLLSRFAFIQPVKQRKGDHG